MGCKPKKKMSACSGGCHHDGLHEMAFASGTAVLRVSS